MADIETIGGGGAAGLIMGLISAVGVAVGWKKRIEDGEKKDEELDKKITTLKSEVSSEFDKCQRKESERYVLVHTDFKDGFKVVHDRIDAVQENILELNKGISGVHALIHDVLLPEMRKGR